MVPYECPKCRASLESPSSLAGRHEECPHCHAMVLVPTTPASSVVTQEQPKGRRSRTTLVLGVGTLIAISFCIWFFCRGSSVSGGAWSVRGGGSSDLLRGMQVYLLRADCSGTTIRQCYQHVADISKDTASDWRKEAKAYRERPDYNDYKDAADRYEADAKAEDEYAATVIANAKNIPDRLDVLDAYRTVRHVVDSSPLSKTVSIAFPLGDNFFGGVIQECAQNSAQVNIDGKFALHGVPRGKYYLFAWRSTTSSGIEWLIPVDVNMSGTINQDIFNDSAEWIWNKRD